MYFGDVPTVQTHLHADWNLLMRHLKKREDQHFELLQYNRKIITRKRDMETNVFINDEIVQHQAFLDENDRLELKMTAEEDEIIRKYEGQVVTYQDIIKLMVRVGARVLQACQASVEKLKGLDSDVLEKHSQMKGFLIKLMKERDRIDLGSTVSIVVHYTRDKMRLQAERLNHLIRSLEEGEIERLDSIYFGKKKQIVTAFETAKKQPVVLQERRLSKADQVAYLTYHAAQRQQYQKEEQLKKQKQKLACKLLTVLYNTMDISKPQFIDDMAIGSCQKDKFNQIYNEAFSRNKLNHEQIIAFEAKKDEYEAKLKAFKEMMKLQNQKIHEVMIKKPLANREKFEKVSDQLVETFDEGIANKTKNPELQEKSHKTAVGARYKLISSRLQKNTTILWTTQDHFTHIKFDSANQELLHHKNRARLPQISTRGASFEVKTARQRLFRELRTPRTHMELKNVEVGVQGVMRRDDSLCDKERKRMSEPHPMEYTFYVRRSTQKFQESKFNIF